MENEIEKRYGKLTVIEKLDRRKHNTSVYLCKCDWGKECVASTSCLVNGDVIFCGCRRNVPECGYNLLFILYKS